MGVVVNCRDKKCLHEWCDRNRKRCDALIVDPWTTATILPGARADLGGERMTLPTGADPLTPEEIEELRRLNAAATPGPWKLWNGWGPSPSDGLMRVARIGPSGSGGLEPPMGSDIAGPLADLEMTVLAHNALPRLLAEIERLREENDYLKTRLDPWITRAAEAEAQWDRHREALKSIVEVGCRHPKPVVTCGSCIARAALARGEA